METPQLILASGSPRRQQFFRELGLTFRVLAADIDETPRPREHPGGMTCRLAEEKARAVATRLEAESAPRETKAAPKAAGRLLIVASDTTVALGDEIYGKPQDEDDARRMLRDLRNKPHQVFSAVSVLQAPGDRQATRINTTTVFMRDYGDDEIEAYIASGDPLDKAGAYGIQAPEFHCVAHLQGCYAGVMGLPLADLAELLGEFGLEVPRDVQEVCKRHNPFGCCAAARSHAVDIALES